MRGLSREETIALILSVGKQGKRKLSPVQVSEALQRSVDAGSTLSELGDALPISIDMVKQFLALGRLSEHSRPLIDWGASDSSLGFSSAVAISRIADHGIQDELARRAVELGLSKEQVIQIVQRLKRSDVSVDRAIDDILALKPIVDRRHIYIGSILSAKASSAIAAMSESGRSAALQDTLGSLGIVASGRLLPTHFVLSISDEVFQRLSDTLNNLERAVTGELEKSY